MANDEPPEDAELEPPSLDAPGADVGDRPMWILILGAVFAGLTLLFFMLLVISSVFGYNVPANARFFVIAVLSLGSATSAGFLGGAAVIHGKFRSQVIQKNPIAFSAAGGIAVLLIVLLFGYFLYPKPATRLNYVVVPIPSQIPTDFTVKNLSTNRIADIGEVRTNGNKRFLYVEFRQGEENGDIRISFPKIPGPGFETPEFQVDLNGTLTPNDG